MTDAWDPAQYEQFVVQRSRPFHDLVDLVESDRGALGSGHRVVDLGCGTGRLTRWLGDRWFGAEVQGVDNSPSMLAAATDHASGTVRFEVGDIAALGSLGRAPAEKFDVVVASASLHWVPDHAPVLADWVARLRPGGVLAVQVPANPDHPSHATSAEVAHEPEFLDALGGDVPPDPVAVNVASPAWYAERLDELGAVEQTVRMEVYGMTMPSLAAVVEWVRGTSLTRFETRMSPEVFGRFVARYHERLVEQVGDRRPYFYAFQRILFTARFA